MFVTYDLRQSPNGLGAQPPVIIRGAKEVRTAGPVTRWEVGEFEAPSGKKIFGVRVFHSRGSEIIEVPAHAENVRVHERRLPPQYEPALKSAA